MRGRPFLALGLAFGGLYVVGANLAPPPAPTRQAKLAAAMTQAQAPKVYEEVHGHAPPEDPDEVIGHSAGEGDGEGGEEHDPDDAGED